MEMNCTKHEIVIGKRGQSDLERPLLTGHAFLNEGESFYSVKLFMFPGQTYYVVKNRDTSKYTIFAKQVVDDRGVRFQNPVGLGQLLNDIMYMEIYFPVLRTQMYMSLYPSAS